MKIYKVHATVGGYDVVDGFVIAAMRVQRARQIASENYGDEGPEVWLQAGSKCELLSRETADLYMAEGVVLRSFRAG